ncbi:MAG: FtsX-like permease family protein [Schleiferiaceae bacterium]
MAMGMILMIVSIATGTGLQQRIKDKIIGFTGHIKISRYVANESFETLPISVEQDFASQLPDIEGVKHIQPFATKAGILKANEDFEGVVLKGIDPTYDLSFLKSVMIEGDIPTFSSTRNDSVVLSKEIADALQLTLGDRVEMYFLREAPKPPRLRKFYISGIFETGLEDFDKIFLIGDLKHIQILNKWDSTYVGGFEVLIDDFDKVAQLTETLRTEIPYDLEAQSATSTHERIFQWLALFDINIALIIGIMIAVATLNMVSVLLILILERTQMIGVLKAVGANNSTIRNIFLYQATYLVTRGLLIGNAIGLAFCFLQSQFGWIKLDQTTYHVSEVPIYLNPWHWLILNVGTLLVSYALLIIPSLLVARIRPVKAIRFD